MKTLIRIVLAVIALWCACAVPSRSEDRVALVVGNDLYPAEGNFPSLDNCTSDATLIRTTLTSLGFRVFHAENATRAEMDTILSDFENAIPKGGTAVFYFAGHGIEFDGKNYLMGSNAKLQARSRLGEEAMDAETFASAMLVAGAKSSFLFLDCCREVPTDVAWLTRGTKKRGLAELNIDGDIIIAYAAKPGQAALDGQDGNSPYAKALSKWLPSGKKHSDLFDLVRLEVHQTTAGAQRTWESGSFLEPFFFKPGGTVITTAPLPESLPTLPAPAPVANPAMTQAGGEMVHFQQQLQKILADHPQTQVSLVAVRARLGSLLVQLGKVSTAGLPEDLRAGYLDFIASIRDEYGILKEMPDDFPWSDPNEIQRRIGQMTPSNPNLVAKIARIPQLEIDIQQKGTLVDGIMAKYGIYIPAAPGSQVMRGEAENGAALERFRSQLTNAIKKNRAPQEGATNAAQMDYFKRLAADILLVNNEGLPEDLQTAFENFRKPLLAIAQILSELPSDLDWNDVQAMGKFGAELATTNPALAQRLVSVTALVIDVQNAGYAVDTVLARYGIVIE